MQNAFVKKKKERKKKKSEQKQTVAHSLFLFIIYQFSTRNEQLTTVRKTKVLFRVNNLIDHS